MEFRLQIYLCVFSILYLIHPIRSQEVLLEISQGILRGRTATNIDGGIFYSFQSIPYAQPPLNELRFKAPVPADGWEGVWDATQDLPSCWAFSTTQPIFYGQEDCLYLNIYTPELPTGNVTGKPVMAFIHGGGFTAGSAQTSWYGPELLLTKDVVLVTLNYRTGIFGFFNLNDPELEVPGNAGMKDQVLALKWVKDNIERFGGNPNDITIFGESGGGISVHLHMLSQISEGLFNKAIAQSGVAFMGIFHGIRGVKNNGEVVAQALGLQTENWSEMLESLRNLSAEEIVVATQIISSNDVEFTSPIVEEPSNEPAFLLNKPLDIIRSGNYHHVPFLLGSNDEEGLMLQTQSLETTGKDLLIEDFTEFVPGEFEIAPGSEDEEIVAQKIKEFYYGDTQPTREDISQAVNLYTDYMFAFPAYRTVLEHLKSLSAPMYFYLFTADTVLNFMKQLYPALQAFPGATHADELGYMFHTSFTPSVIEVGGVEDLAWRNMVNLWTNFAIYGNPTPDDSNGFIWEPVNENTFNFVYITTNETYSAVDPTPVNMQFWYDLYQEYFPKN